MGIEGIAIAAAAVLFVAIVLPALTRGRTVAAEVPADERFAPELRILRKRDYSHTDTSQDRCKIFTTERMMETNNMKERTRHTDERTSTVRALARRRSHAKASIAARQALRIRFAIGAALLVGVSIILWVLVTSLKIALVAPLVLTSVSVLYIAGFIYLARMWHRMDAEDKLAIAEAEDQLDAMNVHRVVSRRKGRTPRAAISEVQDERSKVSHLSAEKTVLGDEIVRGDETAHGSKTVRDGETARSAYVRAANHTANHAELTANRHEREKGTYIAESHIREGERISARERSEVPQENRVRKDSRSEAAQKIVVPVYTLKPSRVSRANSEEMLSMRGSLGVRRSAVEIFDASASADAPVPYRPKAMGERLGDAALEAAIAPSAEVSTEFNEESVTRQENHQDTRSSEETLARQETRQDVLGVGDALDSLLARRRA